MKILQTSNIYFGRFFKEQYAAGNKLRAAIKTAFSGIIDIARDEKVDLVLMVGDVFDNIDLSHNMLEFFVSEIERLENIPAVIMPGYNDSYKPVGFWELWKISPPVKNLFTIADISSAVKEFPELSAAVYGFPVSGSESIKDFLRKIKRDESIKYHIAAVLTDRNEEESKSGFANLQALDIQEFDYIAVGGPEKKTEFPMLNTKAVASGTPLNLSGKEESSRSISIININNNSVEIESRNIDSFVWKSTEITMDTVLDAEDLKKRILEFSGQNTLLKVNLTGLTLLEVGLNFDDIQAELEEHFLNLEIEDNTRVLPENISEVKVHEKTILGQYLKVMVNRLNEADGGDRKLLEKSLKVGYSLLSGRHVW